jgi:ferrochelatase
MQKRDAVLLMAYGGPESLDDIEPYLLDVRGGRPVSPEFLREVRDRYALIGGRSPLRERTFEQAAALQRELGRPVYVGMRHWKPYLADTLKVMSADGITHVTAVAMAPHYSRMSIGAYRRRVEEACNGINVTFVESWHEHPLFLEAVAGRVRAAENGTKAEVIFTAHSLPERILAEGDPYHQEFLASAEAVASLLGLPRFRWAYQSAGATADKWLGPEVTEVLNELHRDGARDVLIVPIGFVCDHVEVLYDVDIFYRRHAQSLGMNLRRTASLNSYPSFIRALAAIVREAEQP